MGIITDHWSASGPSRLGDYHIEFSLKYPVPHDFVESLLAAKAANSVDFDRLRWFFNVWKNAGLSIVTDYGTWKLNHDPRGGNDIEIGALCMANATTNNWGNYPYTIAHAWMHAAINARAAQLKGIDANGSFEVDVEPSVLQNGPIFNLSTHAERAIQTYNPPPDGAFDEEHARKFGYFLGSGDPNLRWDLTILDQSQLSHLKASLSSGDARSLAFESADWIRARTHEIKTAGISDFWGLDK